MNNWRRSTVLLGFVALVQIAGSAKAEAPETTTDLRCVIVAMKVMSVDNPTMRDSGMNAAMYFLGRLDGRTPTLDLSTRIVEEVGKLSAADLRAAAKSCSVIMGDRGRTMREIAKQLGAAAVRPS